LFIQNKQIKFILFQELLESTNQENLFN